MMYPYMTLSDETEIVHSHLIEEDGVRKVIVNFERPTETGFDTARCELPEYLWTVREGYSDDEIALFEQLPQSNIHLLYKRAERGGIQIAWTFYNNVRKAHSFRRGLDSSINVQKY